MDKLLYALVTRVWKGHASGITGTLMDQANGGQIAEMVTNILATVLPTVVAGPFGPIVTYLVSFAVGYFFPKNVE